MGECGSSWKVAHPIMSCFPTNWRSYTVNSSFLGAPTVISNDCSLVKSDTVDPGENLPPGIFGAEDGARFEQPLPTFFVGDHGEPVRGLTTPPQ